MGQCAQKLATIASSSHMIAPLQTPALREVNLPPDAVLGYGNVCVLYQSRNNLIPAFPCMYLCGWPFFIPLLPIQIKSRVLEPLVIFTFSPVPKVR